MSKSDNLGFGFLANLEKDWDKADYLAKELEKVTRKKIKYKGSDLYLTVSGNSLFISRDSDFTQPLSRTSVLSKDKVGGWNVQLKTLGTAVDLGYKSKYFSPSSFSYAFDFALEVASPPSYKERELEYLLDCFPLDDLHKAEILRSGIKYQERSEVLFFPAEKQAGYSASLGSLTGVQQANGGITLGKFYWGAKKVDDENDPRLRFLSQYGKYLKFGSEKVIQWLYKGEEHLSLVYPVLDIKEYLEIWSWLLRGDPEFLKLDEYKKMNLREGAQNKTSGVEVIGDVFIRNSNAQQNPSFKIIKKDDKIYFFPFSLAFNHPRNLDLGHGGGKNVKPKEWKDTEKFYKKSLEDTKGVILTEIYPQKIRDVLGE